MFKLLAVLALPLTAMLLMCSAALAEEAAAPAASAAEVEDNCFFLSRQVDTDYATTVENVKAALKGVGFGVLWETDLQKIMKEKLSVDIPPYVILGACNPGEAHKAFQAEPWIGTLMPCNVVVRQDADGKVWVGAKHPYTIANETGNEAILDMADDLTATITSVLAGL